MLENRLADTEKHLADSLERLASLETRFMNLDQKKDKQTGRKDDKRRAQLEEVFDAPSLPILPEVRKVGYQEFKNRSKDDENQYAIEVLMAGFDVKQDVQEARLRNTENVPNMPFFMSRDGILIRDYQATVKPGTSATPSKRSPYRIRIQSLPLLIILNNVIGYGRKTEATTFSRPFKPLIHYQDTMKQILGELEAKWAKIEHKAPTEDPSSVPVASSGSVVQVGEHTTCRSRSDSEGTHSADIVDSVEALRAMRVYVEFVERHLIPLYHQFDESNSDIPPHKIRFDDLWYLFRLGELAFNPDAPDPSSSLKTDVSSRSRRVMRVYSIGYPDHGTEGYSHNDKVLVRCYFIDFNGDAYVPVKQKFVIPYYEGEKEIRSLDIYPIRYAYNYQCILQEHLDQGKLFQNYVTEKFLSYKGWTFGDHDYPEYIDSDVIVDFVEALKAHPRWATPPHAPALHDADAHHFVKDDIPIIVWNDRDRSEIMGKFHDEIYTATPVDIRERNANLQNDSFLEDRREKRKNSDDGLSSVIDQKDFVLFPRRLFVYSLQDRKFVAVDIRNLRYIADQGEAFQNVIISKEHRSTITALVDAHFERKDFEKDPAMLSLNQDTFRNKGRGLVILLHGVPGVGKTSTAEAVAHAKKKPLFTITCGDLGFSPSEVESSLKEIFRLAHLWDCVLLLDEADVFLSQRSTWDLKRNALVSVFLRILEYYNGILFLTTNRVGTLDAAFKSRIHVQLYYPPLSEKQTKGIWKMNLRQLDKIERERRKIFESRKIYDELQELPLKVDEEGILDFALSYWKQHQHGKGQWNGRQIRNAFQIAAALARFEIRSAAQKARKAGNTQSSATPNQGDLNARHFRAVAKTSHHFELYMHETMGKTEAELAYEQRERSDHVSRLRHTMGESPMMHEKFSFDYEVGSGGNNAPRDEPRFVEAHYGKDWGAQDHPDIPQGLYPNKIPAGRTGPRVAIPMQHVEPSMSTQLSIDVGRRGQPVMRPGRSPSPQPVAVGTGRQSQRGGGAWSGIESGSDYEGY
ncbi:uncharacterized protein N7482_009595 [Penicillium canariense]|uniref:AAA+ ATPase domain-containing protein n=1 Tax=Penicillium canariense TaxID=189055 RepID=A0A9W9HQF4_9EURO|nr:uncharacterized protein N7482_009595 [Penicillium canariense]KAJ5153117.1 hypothetical protein N7482_009595 [Penicillium canariense]